MVSVCMSRRLDIHTRRAYGDRTCFYFHLRRGAFIFTCIIALRSATYPPGEWKKGGGRDDGSMGLFKV